MRFYWILKLTNPTLQSKKNIENSIKEIISENFIEKVELKINFKVEKTPNHLKIKLKEIQ